MSEKRLIDRKTFIEISSFEPTTAGRLFKDLPKPTLADAVRAGLTMDGGYWVSEGSKSSERDYILFEDFNHYCPFKNRVDNDFDNDYTELCFLNHDNGLDIDCCPEKCESWPTMLKLAKVVGAKTLKDMNDDKIRELVELYAGNYIEIGIVQRSENDIYVEYADHKQRKTLHIYLGALSVGGKEVKIFKWFIKNGFNVLEDI